MTVTVYTHECAYSQTCISFPRLSILLGFMHSHTRPDHGPSVDRSCWAARAAVDKAYSFAGLHTCAIGHGPSAQHLTVFTSSSSAQLYAPKLATDQGQRLAYIRNNLDSFACKSTHNLCCSKRWLSGYKLAPIVR